MTWEAQAQRGASQQIRIVARVKAFCRIGNVPHGGLLIEGQTKGGEHVQHRFGGGRFNVICNTPYALHLQRWHVAGPQERREAALNPGYLRVENGRDLDVWLQFAGRTASVERRCVLAALDGAASVCPALARPEAEADEAVFPPSQTVAWLKVEARPAETRRARSSDPVADAVFYSEPGEIRLAAAARGTEWAEDYWENQGEYVSLSVTARY